MRILHLSSEYPPQAVFGLGRYVLELAEAQAQSGHSVEVATNSFGGELHETVQNGVRIRRCHFPPPPKAPATSAMLLHFNLQLMERCLESRSEREWRPEVINAHDWLTVPAAFHLGRILKTPVVTTIHDVVFNKARHRPFTDEDSYIAGIENWACQFSAATIVLSEAVRKEVIQAYHAPLATTHIVPGGVSILPIQPHEGGQVVEWRSKLVGYQSDFVLYVGRLDPEKGVDTLLEAFRAVRHKGGTDRKLLLAGTGTLEAPLKEMVKSMGLTTSVGFLGYLPQAELRFAYAAADVVVCPSHYEPFGLVALEAQRLGTAVIVSDTGGLVETLKITGGGLSFPVGRSAQLASTLNTLLMDAAMRQRLGLQGKAAIETKFSWKAITKQIDQIYAGVISGPPPVAIVTKPWVHPDSGQLPNTQGTRTAPVAQAVSQEHSEPVADILVLGDPSSEHLHPLIQMLSNLHPQGALQGTIHVVPFLSDGQMPDVENGDLSGRIRFGRFPEGPERERILSQVAVIVAERKAASTIERLKLFDPDAVPTLWVGSGEKTPQSGWVVRSFEELRAVAGKALCDQRLRSAIAPNCKFRLPEVKIEVLARSKPLILHILPQLVTGGAETMLLDLVKATSQECDHCLLSLGPLEGPLPGEFQNIGSKLLNLQGQPAEEVLETISQVQPNLLHLHSISYDPRWIPIHRKLTGIPIIETEHVVNIGSGHFGPVEKVICVSEATRAAHSAYFPLWRENASKFEVVYNGIDEREYLHLPSKEEARKRLGLPLDRPIIGRVSALARNKLPKQAIEVIPEIIRQIPTALFVIVGDGPDRSRCDFLVQELKLERSVVFLGERRDIPQVLRAFDVFAYYTEKEALGNVILEAVAARIPVVTTAVEGTKEALGNACGEAVPLNSPDAFSEAVVKWLSRSTGQPHPNGPLQLDPKFTRKEMARRYGELYIDMTATTPQISNSMLTTNIAVNKLPSESCKEPVSILMPVHNTRKEWLIEALNSILHQTYENWTLILVDDGSAPEYAAWLRNLINAHEVMKKRTRIVQLLKNRGIAGAINAGLSVVETELVARMDSDDRMLPDRLAVQVAAFKCQPNAAIIGGWANLINDQGHLMTGRYQYPTNHSGILEMLGRCCAFAHPTVMYRKAEIEAVGGHRVECTPWDDYDLWVRLAEAGKQFANVPMPLVDYRIHANSASNTHQATVAKGSAQCAERARNLPGTRNNKWKVLFTGPYHSYGIPGRGLSVEQFFFARALSRMPSVELSSFPSDTAILDHGKAVAGQKLIEKAKEIDADLVFTVMGEERLNFLEKDIQALTDLGFCTLNWNCDDHWRFDFTSQWMRHYSFMVTTDPIALRRFSELGYADRIILSQWGCNPFDYIPSHSEKDIDVSFIGQPYGQRPQLIQALTKAGIRVDCHGAGWTDGKEIDWSQMLNILQRSKLSLNFAGASQGSQSQIKARFFEIPACGTFMLTEPAEGMESYLQPGRHFDSFTGVKELVKKAEFWLRHPQRDAYALEASAIIRATHSYHHRMQVILDTIEQRIGQPTGQIQVPVAR